MVDVSKAYSKSRKAGDSEQFMGDTEEKLEAATAAMTAAVDRYTATTCCMCVAAPLGCTIITTTAD